MRDGVKLHTLIFTQKGITEPRPFILNRTPYGIAGTTRADERSLRGACRRRLHLRVPGHSRALHVGRAVRHAAAAARQEDQKAIDESTDTYDTIDWLLKNVPHNTGKGRHARRLLSRLADRDGDARSASGAQGRVAAGVSRGHVHRRRLSPQRRVSPELRLRVRRDDGVGEGAQGIRVRQARISTTGISDSARSRTSTSATCTARFPRGPTSRRTRATTSSGRSSPSRRTSRA